MGRKPESLLGSSVNTMMEKQADNYEREETEWNNLVSLYAGPRTAAVETAALTVRAMIPFTRVVESHSGQFV
jgi:hypothetical protein